MKIVQFIATTGWGGAEKVFTDLCNVLSEKVQLTVVTYENSEILFRLSDRIHVVSLPHASRNNPLTYWSLYKVLNQGQYDLVHTHCAKATEIYHRLRRFVKIPHVATKHNSRRGAIFEKVPYVTAVSPSVVKTVNKGATLIYNGILPVPTSLREHSDGAFKILAIGRLDPIKSFDVLIREVAGLSFDYHLDIVGEGPQKSDLQTLIDDADLNEKITLCGYSDNIPQRIVNADLVVISSRTEGLSLVLIETLFYGSMLISTPVGGAVDILAEDLLSSQNELHIKIEDVYTNYSRYKEKFLQHKNDAKELFDMNCVAESYLTFYHDTLGL